MPGFTITGAATFGSGVQFSADPDPITATAGPTTSVLGANVIAITSFFPFSSVQNGTPPYTYFVSAGVLPTGININSSTGLVAGVPLAGQTLGNVTFTVRDVNNVLASTTPTVGFTTFAVTTGTSSLIAVINQAITAFNPLTIVTGGTAPYTYFISSGTLPTGITLNPTTGQVSGTPTVLQSASSVVFGARDVNDVTVPTTISVSFAVSNTYNVSVALVGGGGGGGQKAPFPTNTFYNAGGGGGGGGVLQQTVPFAIGITYSIVVGGGGTKGGGDPVNGGTLSNGGTGTPSTLSGPTFATLTAGGGGGGASATGPASPNTAFGTTGGTGGGSPSPVSVQGAGGGGAAGLGIPLSTTVPISGGAPGGSGVFSGGAGSASRYSGPAIPVKGYIGAGGGGGGAGGSGVSGSPPGSPTTCFGPTGGLASKGGNGGPGAVVPFTGGTYGGGGGGAAGLGGNFPVAGPSGFAGLGGPGGGGQGRPGYSSGSTTSGSTNTGGGGGGNSSCDSAAGAGGSGVVIISVPTPSYPGSAPGAVVSNPPAAPGQTVLTYNSSGSFTA